MKATEGRGLWLRLIFYLTNLSRFVHQISAVFPPLEPGYNSVVLGESRCQDCEMFCHENMGFEVDSRTCFNSDCICVSRGFKIWVREGCDLSNGHCVRQFSLGPLMRCHESDYKYQRCLFVCQKAVPETSVSCDDLGYCFCDLHARGREESVPPTGGPSGGRKKKGVIFGPGLCAGKGMSECVAFCKSTLGSNLEEVFCLENRDCLCVDASLRRESRQYYDEATGLCDDVFELGSDVQCFPDPKKRDICRLICQNSVKSESFFCRTNNDCYCYAPANRGFSKNDSAPSEAPFKNSTSKDSFHQSKSSKNATSDTFDPKSPKNGSSDSLDPKLPKPGNTKSSNSSASRVVPWPNIIIQIPSNLNSPSDQWKFCIQLLKIEQLGNVICVMGNQRCYCVRKNFQSTGKTFRHPNNFKMIRAFYLGSGVRCANSTINKRMCGELCRKLVDSVQPPFCDLMGKCFCVVNTFNPSSGNDPLIPIPGGCVPSEEDCARHCLKEMNGPVLLDSYLCHGPNCFCVNRRMLTDEDRRCDVTTKSCSSLYPLGGRVRCGPDPIDKKRCLFLCRSTVGAYKFVCDQKGTNCACEKPDPSSGNHTIG